MTCCITLRRPAPDGCPSAHVCRDLILADTPQIGDHLSHAGQSWIVTRRTHEVGEDSEYRLIVDVEAEYVPKGPACPLCGVEPALRWPGEASRG